MPDSYVLFEVIHHSHRHLPSIELLFLALTLIWQGDRVLTVYISLQSLILAGELTH